MYGPVLPKPIWALKHGSTVWPKASTFTRPKISIQTRKGYEPILNYSRSLRTEQPTLVHIWPFSVVLVRQVVTEQIAIIQSLRRLCAWQCLGEYRCHACLLKWEPFPKPLSPKTHLKLTILDPSTH